MVKINESNHPGGVPAVGNGISISFDSVTIELTRKDYEDLIKLVGDKISTDLKDLTELYDKYWNRVKKISELVKLFQNTFYDMSDDWCIKKSPEEIDWKEFDKILELNSELLGFQ